MNNVETREANSLNTIGLDLRDIGASSYLVRDRSCFSVLDHNLSALVPPNVDNLDILNSMSNFLDELEILNGAAVVLI